MGDLDAGADEMGDPYLSRSIMLCRTCMRPLTWETRTELGYKPRTGWYDDTRTDPLVCFNAIGYCHVPLTAREWAYYEAGQRSAIRADRPIATGQPYTVETWTRDDRDPIRVEIRDGIGHVEVNALRQVLMDGGRRVERGTLSGEAVE